MDDRVKEKMFKSIENCHNAWLVRHRPLWFVRHSRRSSPGKQNKCISRDIPSLIARSSSKIGAKVNATMSNSIELPTPAPCGL